VENTPTPASAFPLKTTDQLGREVSIAAKPQRILSLSPANTEILFALGLGDRVVGVDNQSNYPPEAKNKPSVGDYYPTPDMEKIVALSPDLIVGTTEQKDQVIPALEKLGLTVLALNATTVEKVLDGVRLLGRATGSEAAAEKLAGDLDERVRAVTAKTQAVLSEKRPRVLFLAWHDPIYTAGDGSFIGDLIDKAGGNNIAAGLGAFPTIGLEAVLEKNPEIIVANVGHVPGEDATLQWARTEGRLADVAARKNGRVYSIAGDIVDRPGPRLVEALEQLAQFFYPDLFPAQK